MCIHLLDLAVSTKELVNLPAEFIVDLPPKTDISDFSYRDDYGNDSCENRDGDAGAWGRRIYSGITNFLDLNYSIKKKESVENAKINVNNWQYTMIISTIAYVRNRNWRVLRAYTASTAITNWKTLFGLIAISIKKEELYSLGKSKDTQIHGHFGRGNIGNSAILGSTIVCRSLSNPQKQLALDGKVYRGLN